MTNRPDRKKSRQPRPNDWSVTLARAFAEALGSDTLPQVLFAPLIEGTPILPLKIGIRDDLEAAYPQHDARLLCQALTRYCNSDEYLKALRGGKFRHDLAGKPERAITPLERADAKRRWRSQYRDAAAARQQLDQAA